MAGIIAWLSGRPFIFPSLGPSAYVLAFDILPDKSHSAKVVIGGHSCGILGGLISYHLIVSPFALNDLLEPVSQSGAFLGIGAIVALMITAFLMLVFNASHSPACATTLIISLGILPTLIDSLYIILAVILIYFIYLLIQNNLAENFISEPRQS